MLLRNVPYNLIKSYRSLISTREIAHNIDTVSNNCKELKFPVPWGTVTGKLWGSTDKQPLLALHGWMDNAASFDLLAPLLTNSSVLAIDLPGHGRSSWIPKGVPYNEYFNFIAIKAIIDHYGWSKVKLLGHSLGGIFSFGYARIFPNDIKFIISIDSATYVPFSLEEQNKFMQRSINKLIAFSKKDEKSKPSYTKNIAMQRWMDSTINSNLDASTMEILFNRGTVKNSDDTYYYSRDFRLTITGLTPTYSDESLRAMCKSITCPFLVLRANNTMFPSRYWVYAKFLSKHNKHFHLKSLDGCHHMHMTNPRMVADEINAFLEKYDV